MVIMMILWYVSVEDMILNGSSSFEIFWTTDYVDSKVRKVHANFPIQIGIFSNIFEKWQGKNFLKQGKNFHTSDKVKTSSNKVKRSQGKNFLKQGKNFHRIWQGIYRHRRCMYVYVSYLIQNSVSELRAQCERWEMREVVEGVDRVA